MTSKYNITLIFFKSNDNMVTLYSEVADVVNYKDI